jgi:Ca-activated chloride channel homolog
MIAQRLARPTLIALAAGLLLVGCGADEMDATGQHAGPPLSAEPHQDARYEEGAGNSEQYAEWEENDFVDTSEENTSTFSMGVDTAPYTIMRRDLRAGQLPTPESVRTESYINFFDYDYRQPSGDDPFSVNLELAPSVFGEADQKLLRIGLQGKEIDVDDLKPTNLVFLIDVSGSMGSSNKLPLVKESLRTLLDHLRPDDTIGIVVYASQEGVALESTPVSERSTIEAAIDDLEAGGATNADAGIVLAYEMAEDNKIAGGNNRVLIATDGDFNVGRTGDALVQLIQDYRDKEISLTALGFGQGNYNDRIMESLARDGNGNYFYIDTAEEAQRIFGPGLPSTLEVIAADVKVQVEFDPDSVDRYRLIGYETRLLDNEDFDDDTKDAGEIGPGHSVTALYELDLTDQASESTGFLSTVRLRYKDQYGDDSKLIEQGIKVSQIADTFEEASADFRFAASVTEFAEILRESQYSSGARFDDVAQFADDAADSDDDARQEFLELVGLADGLWPE